MPAELADEKEVPECLQYIVEWFQELSAARTAGGFAANPITYADILAWATLTAKDIEPWEVQAIRDLDLHWLSNLVADIK